MVRGHPQIHIPKFIPADSAHFTDTPESQIHAAWREVAERFSIAFFCNPNKETVVECLPNCATADNPPKYKPINAFDYITMRLSGTIEE